MSDGETMVSPNKRQKGKNMNEQKIDRRKHYFLVLDIETANFIDDALAYDIGFAVADRKGNIYESYSFMVAEMFHDYIDLLQSAYYAEKLPQYYADYGAGKRKMKTLYNIRKTVADVMEKYNIKDVWAYNCRFDRNGLNNTIRYITKSASRWFFPYGTEFHCIQHCACQTILQQKTYFRFAIENGLVTEKGNLSTTAESAYRYMTRNMDFIESHTGLEDVQIETAILALCFRQHKKMNTNIAPNAWNLPQKNFKNFKEMLDNSSEG